jgi:dihydrofolate synthase/folylpolyglutamate synthase
MDKKAILEFLYGLQMFGIKLGLDNIRQLLHSVDNPHSGYAIVHVAGTNGKGSVCAFLRALLMRGGYRVGTYTSPHLQQFNERITIDDQQITDDQLAQLVVELRRENPTLCATFFEFTTALALLHFARQQVDIVLLEVGMGGRLDATNVVTPLVSVITPVSLDHTSYLGENLEQIAAEKGGIIKPSVPVVIAPQQPPVLQVLLNLAASRNAPVWYYGRDFSCVKHAQNNGLVDVVTPQATWTDLHPRLLGAHQETNMATALMVLSCLAVHGYGVTPAQVRAAVSSAVWPGRLEWWPDSSPPLLLDGAHNEAGALTLSDYLSANGYDKIRWVGGFKSDKNVAKIVAALAVVTQKFYAVEPPIEQPFPNQEVVSHLLANSVAVQCFADVAAGVEAARHECLAGEIVVVAGSLFLVAACREYLSSLGN